MISKMIQALILSGCLMAAGAASAGERDVIVPVIAGAAVGAIVATVIGKSSHQPDYRPRYQPVAYVPVAPRVEYRRFAPPPPRYHGPSYHRGFDHGRRGGRR